MGEVNIYEPEAQAKPKSPEAAQPQVEVAVPPRGDHQEAPSVVNNLKLLTEISGLSDGARRALAHVHLDPNNSQPAVDALFAAKFEAEEVKEAMLQVLGALNLRAAQTVPAAEAPAVIAPQEAVTPTPAVEVASPPPPVEQDEFAKRLGPLTLRGTVRVALADVDPNDNVAVRNALDQSGASRREMWQVTSLIEELRGRRAPTLAAQPERRWRMPRLDLPPRVAAALKSVDLKNAAAVKAALSKFGTETGAQAMVQLARFRRAVGVAVAKLPKKPAAEAAAQPVEGLEVVVAVESEMEKQPPVAVEAVAPSEDPKAAFSHRVFAAWKRIQDASANPDLLDQLRSDAVREQRAALAWRPELGRQDVQVAEASLLEAVKDHSIKTKGGTSEPTVSSGIPTQLERLTEEYRKEQVKKETPEKARRAQDRQRIESAEEALRTVKTLEREWGSLTAFFEDVGTITQLQKELVSARRDAQYNRGTNKQRAQESAREIASRIANYPTSVDDLLRRVDFPAELRWAIELAREGEPVSVEESGAVGEHVRALYEGLVNDLLGGERPAPPTLAEIPEPERGGEERSTGAPEKLETAEPTVNVAEAEAEAEAEVEAYASGIREGGADAQKFVELLSGLSDEQRNQEVLTLQSAVDQLAEEVKKPDADPQQTAETKKNLKKLGLALVGATALAGIITVQTIIKAIEGAIGETFKIAGS